MADLLAQTVMSALDIQPGQHVLDLYCGGGLFTLPIAHAGALVTAADSNPISTGRRTGQPCASRIKWHRHGVDGGHCHCASPKNHSNTVWDAVVVNPPRTGVTFAALSQLVALRPQKIVCVSCNPATLARDAKLLNKNGWALRNVQPLDMFPQTHHVEVVAVFSQ